MKILHIAGARPNFMKVAPVMAAMEQKAEVFQQWLVHTGQHYDYEMSQVFFDELELPPPDEFLNCGSGTHAEQTARVMLAFEPVLLKYQPGLGLRGRGCQLDAGLRAGVRQAGGAGGARGGRSALLGPDHAGGDQPAADRPGGGFAVHALAGGARPT